MYGPQRRIAPNNLMAAGRIMPPLEAILQQQANQFMPQIPQGEALLKQYLQMQDQLQNEATYGATGPIPELNPNDPMGDIERAALENQARLYGALPGLGGLGPDRDYVAPLSEEEEAAAYGATANIPTPQMAAGPMQVSYEEFISMPPEMQQAVFEQLSPEKRQEFSQRAASEPLDDDYQGGPSAEELFQQGYDEAANDPMRNQELRNQIEMTQQAGNVYQAMVDDVARGNDMLQGQLDKFNKNTPTNPYTGRFLPDFDATQLAPRPGQRADQTMADIASRDVPPMNVALSEEDQGRKNAAIQRALARGDWRTVLKLDPTNQQGKALREQAENTMPEIVRNRLKREGLLNDQPPNQNVAPEIDDFQPIMRPDAPATPDRIPPLQGGLDATRPPIMNPLPPKIVLPENQGNIPPIAPKGEVPEAAPPAVGTPGVRLPSVQQNPGDIPLSSNENIGANSLVANIKSGNIDYLDVMSDPNITDIVKSRLAQEDARSGFALSNRTKPSRDDFMGAMSGMISHYTPGYAGNSLMGRLANRNA